jgi:hypothetical protein
MPDLPPPIFADFEASSLSSESYPIEIAWNIGQDIEPHLINPYCIETWTDWDPSSQAVHGLSRNYLSYHGEHPKSVAERMNQVFSGQTIYFDGIPHDQWWMDELFAAAGIKREFKLAKTQSLFYDLVESSVEYALLEPIERRKSSIELAQRSIEKFKAEQKVVHRAGEDIKPYIHAWLYLQETLNW